MHSYIAILGMKLDIKISPNLAYVLQLCNRKNASSFVLIGVNMQMSNNYQSIRVLKCREEFNNRTVCINYSLKTIYECI